jgi:hypothetical protein
MSTSQNKLSNTQNDLLLQSLLNYYNDTNKLDKIINIINGNSNVSLRIIDWFVTNYSKMNYVVYMHNDKRFKVFHEYKLKLKAYSKKRFDPFCRWDRITIPYNDTLNFFRWALDYGIIDYIENNYAVIEEDMNQRNSTSKKKTTINTVDNTKTRKRREELSVSACKCVKRENVHIIVKFQ